MQTKKIIAVALSAVMAASTVTVTAFAAKPKTEKTYNYVAFGDSIAAGYGLSTDHSVESLMKDPALMLTEDLIAHPIDKAYPAVFGTFLEEIGSQNGYATTATNLSTTAYRAQDVAKTILNEGYVPGQASWIMKAFVGQDADSILANYHNLIEQYLTPADLVSIQLGGNDILMGMLNEMYSNENPIVQALATSLTLTLFGTDMKTAVGAGLMKIQNDKDNITYETVTEAADYLKTLAGGADYYVDNSANQVHEVVKAVKTVNSDADIALLGMFNPYGTSLEYNGQYYDFKTVVKNIFIKAAEEACGEKLNPETAPEETVVPENEPEAEITEEQVEEKVEDCKEHVVDLKKLAGIYNKAKEAASAKVAQVKEKTKEKMKKLVSIIAEEAAYPIQYYTAGKSSEPQMKALNEKLKAVAEEEGCIYVDVYGISNECNLDPHPTASGHYEIAEFMRDTLSETIAADMNSEEVIEEVLSNTSYTDTDAVKAGEKITVSGQAEGGKGGYTYAYYYKRSTNESWKPISKGFIKNTQASFTPTVAVDFDVKVIVKDSEGTTAEKIITINAGSTDELTNISTVSDKSIALGSVVTMRGNAVGGTAPYTYSYYFKRSTNTSYKLLGSEFTENTSARFKPSAAGSYDVKIAVKDAAGNVKEVVFTVTVK